MVGENKDARHRNRFEAVLPACWRRLSVKTDSTYLSCAGSRRKPTNGGYTGDWRRTVIKSRGRLANVQREIHSDDRRIRVEYRQSSPFKLEAQF
jgi:hypothetical protein